MHASRNARSPRRTNNCYPTYIALLLGHEHADALYIMFACTGFPCEKDGQPASCKPAAHAEEQLATSNTEKRHEKRFCLFLLSNVLINQVH